MPASVWGLVHALLYLASPAPPLWPFRNGHNTNTCKVTCVCCHSNTFNTGHCYCHHHSKDAHRLHNARAMHSQHKAKKAAVTAMVHGMITQLLFSQHCPTIIYGQTYSTLHVMRVRCQPGSNGMCCQCSLRVVTLCGGGCLRTHRHVVVNFTGLQ